MISRYPTPQIIHVNGRRLAVECSGPDDGFPVVVLRGSGSRHLFIRDVQDAGTFGFRLINYDRPGYGESEAMPGRRMADAATEVRGIAQYLKVPSLAVTGSSGAGSYTLACAALLPDLVIASCVFGACAPFDADGLDFTEGTSTDARTILGLAVEDSADARAECHAYADLLFQHFSRAESWMERWGDQAGQDSAHDQDWADFLAVSCYDSFVHGDQGAWDDLQARVSPWGFELGDIKCPVALWQGLADKHISPAHGHWLARKIPNVITYFNKDEDHTNIEENNRVAAYRWLRSVVDGREELFDSELPPTRR